MTICCAWRGRPRSAGSTRSSGPTTSSRWACPGSRGRPGPTDSWVTLAGLARETSRIRLGTLVTSATFRLPGPLAVAVAQVDHLELADLDHIELIAAEVAPQLG